MTTLPITKNRFSPPAKTKSGEYTPAHISLMLRMNGEGLYHVSNFQIPTDMVSREGFTKSVYPDIFLAPKLCIYVDGKVHLRPGVAKKDRKSGEWLESHGYIVLRFKNKQIKTDMEAVIQEIRFARDKMMGAAQA